MEIYSILFRISDPGVDLSEPTAISRSCQRPKRNSWAQHLQHTLLTTLQCLSFLLNWWSFAQQKSHLRRGGRTWYPDCHKLHWTGHIGKIELHNLPHFIRKSSATIARITIPVQSCSSFDWVGRHRPNVVKVRKAMLHHWHHLSWTISNQGLHMTRLFTILSQSYVKSEIVLSKRDWDELKQPPCCLLILK